LPRVADFRTTVSNDLRRKFGADAESNIVRKGAEVGAGIYGRSFYAKVVEVDGAGNPGSPAQSVQPILFDIAAQGPPWAILGLMVGGAVVAVAVLVWRRKR
jgi:hypothetical protein